MKDDQPMHTPGPWTVSRLEYPKGRDVSFEVTGRTSFVCQTIMREIGCDDGAIRADEANLRLIAAAPMMYEELLLAADTFRDFSAVLRAIGKDVMSAAADVAERHIREQLAAILPAEGR